MTKKFFKTFFVLFILCSLCINYIYATDIDIDLPNDDQNISDNSNTDTQDQNLGNSADTGNLVDDPNNTEDLAPEPTTTSPSSGEILSPSSISTAPESGLSITNIINILLITVGIIIILLAVAIIK